jgi:hypothetical protein
LTVILPTKQKKINTIQVLLLFWKFGRHPEEIYSLKFMWSKLPYIPLHTILARIIEEASQYIYSSASAYIYNSGLLKIEKVDIPIVDVLTLNNFTRYNKY